MDTGVSLSTTDTHITVESPYDPAFPPRARQINGKWNGSAWIFDVRDADAVRVLCREIYGTDGADSDEPTVTIRVPITTNQFTHRSEDHEFRAAGLRIVWRPGRDLAVRYADGVVLISGGFPASGGSMRYPELLPEPGTVVEVRDIARGTAAKILEEVDGATLMDEQQIDRQALIDERDRLLACVKEIDTLLGEISA